jgi:hypothetical protein
VIIDSVPDDDPIFVNVLVSTMDPLGEFNGVTELEDVLETDDR